MEEQRYDEERAESKGKLKDNLKSSTLRHRHIAGVIFDHELRAEVLL